MKQGFSRTKTPHPNSHKKLQDDGTLLSSDEEDHGYDEESSPTKVIIQEQDEV